MCRIAISSAQWSTVADPTQYVVGAIPTFWEGRFGGPFLLGYTDFMPIEPVAGEDGACRATITSPKTSKLSALSLPSA